MSDHVLQTLKAAGLANESAEELASHVLNPAPGTFEAVELEKASETQIALLAAIVAAARRQQFGNSLEIMQTTVLRR